MFWWTFTASSQLLWCTSRLCFGTSPLFIVYYTPLSSLISLFGLNHHLYADDTQLFISFQASKFSDNISCLQTCLGSIADWMTSNLLCFSSSRTEFLLLGLKPQLDKIQKILHFFWVMVSLFFLQPQLTISVLFLIPILPLLTRSLLFLDLVSITFKIFDAFALFSISLLLSLLAHLLFILGLITVIHYIMVFQKSN